MGTQKSAAFQRWQPRGLTTWAIGLLGIAAIGGFDYASGTELRTYPLYYAPISFLAWYESRRGVLSGSVASAAAWVYSNYAAGLMFSTPGIWIANTALHFGSFFLVGHIIATLHDAKRKAQTLSRTDSLTRLLNRSAFYEDATPILALCKRGSRPVTLAYIDLDNFKWVNDQNGHAVGDALLAKIADAIRHTVRPSDLCARIGGDEFALFLPELPHHEAAGVLERVRLSVAEAAQGTEPAVTASVGGVTYVRAPSALEEIVHQADVLMYEAKEAGRNRLSLKVHDG